jgi:nitrogen permease regulator 3-like protein
MFNLVLAIDANSPLEIDLIHEQIILKITAALKYEQLRRGYVRKEIELILGLREEAIQTFQAPAETSKHIIKSSSLARSLVDIYQNITLGRISPIEINQSVCLSLQIDFTQLELQLGTSTDPKFPVLRPYHAILLLHDPEEIISNMPADASSLLRELIQVVTPTQRYIHIIQL